MATEFDIKGYIYPKCMTVHGEEFVAYFKDNVMPPWFTFMPLIEIAYGNKYIENIHDHWLTISQDNRTMLTLRDDSVVHMVSLQGVVEFLHKKINHNRAKELIRGLKKQVNKALKTMPAPVQDVVSDNNVILNSAGSFLIRSLPIRYARFDNKTWFRGTDLCKVFCNGSTSMFMLAYDEVKNTEKRMVRIDDETCLLLSREGVEQFFQWFDSKERKIYLRELEDGLAGKENTVEEEPEQHCLNLYFTKAPYVEGNVIDCTELQFESKNKHEVVSVFTAFVETETGLKFFFKPTDVCHMLDLANVRTIGIPWEEKVCFSLREDDRRRTVLLSAEGIKALLKKTSVKDRAVRYSEILEKIAQKYEQRYTDWFEYRKRKYAAYNLIHRSEDIMVNMKDKINELLKTGDTVDYVCGAILLAEALRACLAKSRAGSQIVTGKGLPGPKTKQLVDDLWKFIDTQDPRQEVSFLFLRAVNKAWARYEYITA